MLEQNNYIDYNKIEQHLVSLLSECHQWETCEINNCKNVE